MIYSDAYLKLETTCETKGIPTSSVSGSSGSLRLDLIGIHCDAWEWVWDRFLSITMYFNEIQSDTAADADAATATDARCRLPFSAPTKVKLNIPQ